MDVVLTVWGFTPFGGVTPAFHVTFVTMGLVSTSSDTAPFPSAAASKPLDSSQLSLKILDRYLTPLSGKTVTMTEPSSTSPERTRAAWRFNPADPPRSKPSLAATSRHMANASSSLPRTIPSITFTSNAPGMESFPTPSISQLLETLTSSAGTPLTMWSQNTEPWGSAITTRISGFCDLRYRPVPLTVPPVLPPAMKCVTAPEVWCQISGPSVTSYASVLYGLLYWSTP